MNDKDVQTAIAEARRFVRIAEQIRWDKREWGTFPRSTVETAAARRASMDLTRALAKMRRYA